MPDTESSTFQTRRRLCVATATTLAAAPLGLIGCSERKEAMNEVAEKKAAPAAGSAELRPFTYKASDADLADLRRRIEATRWPDSETVKDSKQGVQLATIQKLAQHWATKHDWRKVEERINAVPNFITNIDGLDFHFMHIRSKHENAFPLLVAHGWPGSIIEQMKIIGPLTDPTAHGGTEADAFHLVIPSMPGYGFSARPTTTGWDPVRIAAAYNTLMPRLGYKKWGAAGGDWGAIVVEQMALKTP